MIKVLERLKRKIFLLIGRCLLTAINNDGETQVIQVQGLDGETISDIDRFQPYGFETYPPLENSEPLVLFVNGNREKGICALVHNRYYRPTDLDSNDVCMYNKDSALGNANRITIKTTDNTIEIKTYDGNIWTIDSNGTIRQCKNNNKETFDNNGIKLEDKNNNVIEMKAGKIAATGTAIDLLGATEANIKGTTLCTAFTTLCSTISGATSGTTAQNAAGIETIKAAFSVFNGQINNFKSATIKVE